MYICSLLEGHVLTLFGIAFPSCKCTPIIPVGLLGYGTLPEIEFSAAEGLSKVADFLGIRSYDTPRYIPNAYYCQFNFLTGV